MKLCVEDGPPNAHTCDGEVSGGGEAGEDAEATEDALRQTDADDEEGFGLQQPEQGPVCSAEAERNGGQQQHGGDGGEHDECGAVARLGEEAEDEFGDTEHQQAPEGPLGVAGLVLQQAEQAHGIEDGGKGSEQLLLRVRGCAEDVDQAEDEPVG